MKANRFDLAGRKIRALLILKGISQRDICREVGVNPSTVSLIISGKKTSRRVRAAIAQALGVTVEELWPKNGHKKAA